MTLTANAAMVCITSIWQLVKKVRLHSTDGDERTNTTNALTGSRIVTFLLIAYALLVSCLRE